MKTSLPLIGLLLVLVPDLHPGDPPLLSREVVAALASEVSGEVAKRNLEFIARQHRMRASRGYRAAAEYIAAQLRDYGLRDVHIEQFPADGHTMYGTQKSRPAWDADFAELWELRQTADGWERDVRLASWDAMPITLAQDSDSADVVADLVDVGAGTSESDYAGKDVRGKIVLTSSQPGVTAALAVDRYGAAGMVSYAQNQVTAWWKEDENFVRWGHLDSFSPHRTFAFMVSLKQARAFQERFGRGERIRLHATVEAARHQGLYDIVTAVIPGADPQLRNEEIAFSCHLDHQRPGANDNASGCVTILEVARTLQKLIDEGRISRPDRSIRFIWPPEIEGTTIFLSQRPQVAERIKAAVHMDMVGGGPITKAMFHVTRGPMSLPSFVYDVSQVFGAFVNEQTAAYASTRVAEFPFVAPEGGKEALQAELVEFTSGSDHEVYTEGSFRIPAIYLNDWPDRFIHTNFDLPANIDPTKLERAGFIGAASAYYLATLGAEDMPRLLQVIEPLSLRRTAAMLERRAGLPAAEAASLTRTHLWYERELLESIGAFAPGELPPTARQFLERLEVLVGGAAAAPAPRGDGALVYRRDPSAKGPMSVFGYDYFGDRYEGPPVRLFRHGARWGEGAYTYEVLNLVDGRRTAQEIRDIVSAEFGPVPLELVVEYLRALESAGVIGR
jgi:aminopeptidase YwaD